MKLAIHTEEQQNVCFREGQEEEALENAKPTTLMAYFQLNKDDIDAQNIKYQDIPEYYTWDASKHKWCKRKSQPKEDEPPRTIGRVANVLPIQGEKFYLRILLNHKTGATSFSNLKILDGKAYETYKEVCLEMGLLQDDGEWITSMEEVSKYGSTRQIRSTFAVILQYCQPTKPRVLFDMFLTSMSDDYTRKIIKEKKKDTLDGHEVFEVTNCVLRDVDAELRQMGASLSDFPDLPTPPPITKNEIEARVMRDEIFEIGSQEVIVKQLEHSINYGQSELCKAVFKAVHALPGKLFVY